jgi:rubrerythrin
MPAPVEAHTHKLPNVVLQSNVAAFHEMMDKDRGKTLNRIGVGLLTLENDNSVGFVRKKFLGGYERELNHGFYLSNILKTKSYSDGLEVEVYYPATAEESAEVMTYFYELNTDDAEKWQEALKAKRKEKPPETRPAESVQLPVREREVIREKEVIREIVKVRCAHCRTLYEENLGRCPHCGAPSP